MQRTIFVKKISILTLTGILTFLTGMLTSTVTFSATPNIISKNWYNEELLEKRKILEAFWQKRIIVYNKKSVDDFRSTIIANHFPENPLWSMKIEKLFTDAINQKINFNLFFNTIKDQPLLLIEIMNDVEKLIPQDHFKESYPHINKRNLKQLEEYFKDKHFSASITLGDAEAKIITPDFPENQFNNTFAIHSVGKVFTGILTLIMIREGILSENDLARPVQLDDAVIKQLPPTVTEQLKHVTLYQLMTHKAGLGDYLGNYCFAISQGHLPIIKHAEDFLPFVEDKTFPTGEYRYSNAGILLVGLAIKHAYEEKTHHPIDYDDILKKYIIDEVGMPSFTPWKPQNGKYNSADPVAPYIVGGPAGGYWMTSVDLARFGQWLYKKSCTDSAFKKLIEKYGQEFYYADNQSIIHSGGIRSSMAFFSVSLKTGAILSLVSNQPPPQASDLKEMIQRHFFSQKVVENIVVMQNK